MLRTSHRCYARNHATCTYGPCECSCHTPSDRKDTTVTDFTPTHRIIGNTKNPNHHFHVDELVQATGKTGTGGTPDYVNAEGRGQYVADVDVEELKPTYEDGKLYTLTREVRYDAENGVFRSTWQAPDVRRGILPADIEADPSGSVVRIPDPLPTGFGAIVRKDGDRYSLIDPEDSTDQWRSERGGWFSNEDLVGADVLYPGDPQ